ncbi:DUF2157 domain-containing protein [Leeuwenhoekiella nanhaiensis]|uniref:DUF2157 domain-containing protein n=1 Tax=Leeuwenhoekiella nanhaiensis TaxID=1655491 RepID=UPI001CB9639E|nr:DUF2157 domain-containing protein [Leeuwenhoekiella nanhaiensis]
MNRKDIHIINRNSTISEKQVAKALDEHVYSNKKSWQKFLKVFFISLGLGFTLTGVIFFFAYNWADLHKFVKIGLISGLLIGTSLLALWPQINTFLRKITITGASVLVGVLFAVYGQIYQTGANAYDFFLAWTIFISIWVVVSNFAPLWLLFIILINTTSILYYQQVANDWSETLICLLLFIFNTIVLITSSSTKKIKSPDWFNNVLALMAVSYATIGFIFGLYENDHLIFFLILVFILIIYSAGVLRDLKTKNIYNISLISLSLTIIIAAFMIKVTESEQVLILVSVFIIMSISFSIKKMIDLQKKWKNEN